MPTVLVVGPPEPADPVALRPLLETLAERGHRVLLLGTEPLRRVAADGGAEFRLLPPSPQPAALPRGTVARARATLRHHFLDPVEAHWTATRAVVRQEDVDVVLADALCLGACMLAGLPRADRPPVVVLGTIPPPHDDADLPPYGLGLLPEDSPLNAVRNTVLRVLVRHVVVRPVLRQVRAAFRRLSGVEMARDTYAAARDADRWAECSAPRLAYPDRRPPANLRRVGPLAVPAPAPLPGWLDPADPRPIVQIRSTPRAPLAELVLPALEAFGGDDGVRLLLSGVPRSDVEAATGAPLPAHVLVVEESPAAQVLPGTRASVQRGDFTTVQQALQQGVPVVAYGTDAGELETAARLRWHGSGLRLRTDRPSAVELRQAVSAVLLDPAMGRAAAAYAAQAAAMRAEPAIADLVDELVRRPVPDPTRS